MKDINTPNKKKNIIVRINNNSITANEIEIFLRKLKQSRLLK